MLRNKVISEILNVVNNALNDSVGVTTMTTRPISTLLSIEQTTLLVVSCIHHFNSDFFAVSLWNNWKHTVKFADIINNITPLLSSIATNSLFSRPDTTVAALIGGGNAYLLNNQVQQFVIEPPRAFPLYPWIKIANSIDTFEIDEDVLQKHLIISNKNTRI